MSCCSKEVIVGLASKLSIQDSRGRPEIATTSVVVGQVFSALVVHSNPLSQFRWFSLDLVGSDALTSSAIPVYRYTDCHQAGALVLGQSQCRLSLLIQVKRKHLADHMDVAHLR